MMNTTREMIDLSGRKIAAVLNTASGTCTPESKDEMLAILQEFNVTPAHVWCGSSEGLSVAFDEVKSIQANVLIVLGGDGTIRSAAEQCTGAGPLLIPLPGGTMNVLPKALYGEGSWQDILRKICANPTIKKVSGGEIQGHRFFISAICGAPSLWANAREAVRAGALDKAVEHGKIALDHMFASKISYRFNEMNEGTTEALTITCPLVSSQLDDDRRVFEAAVIDMNHAGEILELVTAAAFGEWRDSKNVAIVNTPKVTVTSEQDIPVILDGETIDVGHEADFSFIKEAFVAIIPADEILS